MVNFSLETDDFSVCLKDNINITLFNTRTTLYADNILCVCIHIYMCVCIIKL